jgi:gluconate kinase
VSGSVLILYGEMGAGKTFWGQKLARVCKAAFLDGDDVISAAMLERTKNFKPISKKTLDDYVQNHLAPAIIVRCGLDNDLIVAQALYLREHRDFLKQHLLSKGYDQVEFIRIEAPFWRNLKQLWARPQGLRWVWYWLLNKPFFQP